MASSNRHWPSMFKSKPCNSHAHHQWQHDINPNHLISSTACHRSSYSSVGGCDERSPEPKPRWNPKPEQIRILEAIFNSGMVNPPRDEIRKIRAQLQEYGQVGDANVFYWFQNRKSRSKHKLRHLHSHHTSKVPPNSITVPSSSSSSSEKSSPNLKPKNKGSVSNFTNNVTTDLSNSPTASVNQGYNSFQPHGEFLRGGEASFFNGSGQVGNYTQGFCLSDLTSMVQHVPEHQGVGPCTSLLLSELMYNNNGVNSKKDNSGEKFFMGKVQQSPLMMMNNYTSSTVAQTVASSSITTSSTCLTIPSPIDQIQGLDEAGGVGHVNGAKSTVIINDVAFEVAAGPLNVREAFGDEAVLIHSSGQPVLTNEWGFTIQSLQDGACYYLI